MKSYINIFLTLVMPLSLLFTTVSIIYYSMEFTFSTAIKIGILTGVLSSSLFSLVLGAIILLIPKTQLNKPKTFKEHKENFNTDIVSPQVKEKRFILLMDRELAYEVSLQSMQHQNVGEIINHNKDKGLILLKDDLKELKINITTLTKHTSEIIITSTLGHHFIKDIISLIKTKERLFLHY